MRIIGIDPSSTFVGNAIIETPDTIIGVKHWERDKKLSHPEGFKSYFEWQMLRLFSTKPHMAIIEMGAYALGRGGKGNFQALQAVSFYQSIAVLTCKLQGLVVIESRATSARKAALGNGALSKDAVWDLMKVRYDGLFAPKTRGGLDECDALVLALAGERVAER